MYDSGASAERIVAGLGSKLNGTSSTYSCDSEGWQFPLCRKLGSRNVSTLAGNYIISTGVGVLLETNITVNKTPQI
jgi:hypothetical protein